ncbi:Multidrug export protein EmrB [Fundidesulfovibrio magnetotacticus]|uniref:Multidrug export protein EmrB n=1 Tax=Fundidesulfovibrio magnetotacticus TaxID=2730080 RepID=A0A6V8LTA6_9BACT|nr:DHA2 family efflux MFS transporter permease subunit [Fundidesulfovibrio magnetotacticus]GFK93811.1 Multidrug export protein EmrB [Fundidesulfovibrio magnetotacticus]
MPAQHHAPWRPRASLWVIAPSVMLPTIMEVLDTTMANVALPQMAGNLSASHEEATWVLTSYLVANAIVLPLTGWFSVRFGRRRFLLACVALFTLASAWCAAVGSMPMLILARIVQGAAGGALQPLSQAILMESAPPEKRGTAMAIFGMGVVVAPIVGPTLGGWLTDHYSWRWMFTINIPVGVAAFLMCRTFIEDPPYLEAQRRKAGGVDVTGFAIMALWLATLQIVLDKGQQENWFETGWILWFSVISLLSMVAFIVWELRAEHPIVDLRVFKDANFAIGTGMMTLLGVVLYATITLQPLYLQTLMGYTALDSGLALSPRGIGAIVSMVLVSRLINRVDARKLIAGGFLILGLTSLYFSTINLQISQGHIAWPNVIMGLSMGFIFVPLTMLSMASMPQHRMGTASGLFNLMRNIGGGVGISVVTTMVARGSQSHQTLLAGHMTPANPRFNEFFQGLTAYFTQGFDPVAAKQKALAVLEQLLLQQSALLAYLDSFRLLGMVSLVCVAGALFMRRRAARGGSVALH